MTDTTKPTKKATKKATKEMVEMYHQWRLLKKQVEEMETSLKAWTDEFGPLPVSDSDVYGPLPQVEESINPASPVFADVAPALFGDHLKLLLNQTAPKGNFDTVCKVLAKERGTSAKEVQEELWQTLKASGCIKVTTKTVYRERTAPLGQ